MDQSLARKWSRAKNTTGKVVVRSEAIGGSLLSCRVIFACHRQQLPDRWNWECSTRKCVVLLTPATSSGTDRANTLSEQATTWWQSGLSSQHGFPDHQMQLQNLQLSLSRTFGQVAILLWITQETEQINATLEASKAYVPLRRLVVIQYRAEGDRIMQRRQTC